MTDSYVTEAGLRNPPGARADSGGVNFAIFSRHATEVELLLFRQADSPGPFQVIPLQFEIHSTFCTWHVYVRELPPGTWYTWRMNGPGNTRETGLRFDAEKLLLDPWARAVSHQLWDRQVASEPGANDESSMRAMVIANGEYNWEDDAPLIIPNESAIIYELHVGGFTRHSSSGTAQPGTFAGLIEKIPYLKSLGITHIELMPIMAFDEQDVPPDTAALGLKNYWGYSTHSFFSPHPGYCVSPDQGAHLDEFRDLVKALHRAGIGIILDVVFNHTAEGGADGPTINFKGMGNSVFYHLDGQDKRVFSDYTGCGNTVNCNHPIVANFIIACLEYWVREMHVDGFRFDLASALARGEQGEPLRDPPVLWGIELSEPLTGTRLIAEAWDAAGLYQVGSFPGYRWAEWNGRYRDVIRRFIRGDRGMLAEVATRMSGSSDLYQPQNRLPSNSINFVTCHDGFTLYDLFSYEQKHNQANGEDNRDGNNENLSFNCGVEGDTRDRKVLAMRRQHARNAIAILLLSQGVPMLLAGDEVLNTQQGNNNGYCQDNELTWIDWTLLEKNVGMLNFVRQMIALRKRHPSLMHSRFLTGNTAEGRELPDVSWHGRELGAPLWNDPHARVLAFTLGAIDADESDLHVMLNMSEAVAEISVPQIAGSTWHLAISTDRDAPDDIVPPELQKTLSRPSYQVPPRAVVVLESG